MRNFVFFLYSIAFTVMIACSQQPKDAKKIADSINRSNSGATTAATITNVNNADALFATSAADAGLAEINLANIAVVNSNNQEIKAYANMMLKDHGTGNDELIALAKVKNIALPSVMSSGYETVKADLMKKQGIEFDKKYADLMEEDHVKVLKMMEEQALKGIDPDLRAFASKMVPVIKAHLNAVRKIKDNLK